jgi:putative effector of murein hydrolase
MLKTSALAVAAIVPAMRLDFDKPMKATNRVEFTLMPKGVSTGVTWTVSGSMTSLHKLMTTFVSMDKMVGSQFEAGLAALKAAGERG